MKYFMAVLSMLFMGTLTAQQIKGQVINEMGFPLEDAGIFNKNKGQHSHSDGTGHFVLDQTSVNDTIYFSRLGYETKTYVVNSSDFENSINVILNESAISLDQVVLVSKVDAFNKVVDVDLKTNPVKSSQEILRKVPGLIIGQHAGGGKAEQLFLRGFDVDHGTDVAIGVEGMPVNMVSHAHGQGYADLHFVIPETIENINFGKGPYYADQGDFNTAGYVNLKLRKSLDKSILSAEVGQFGARRLMGMFNVLENQNSNAYLATELYLMDGPFESPQNFNRVNILGRYRFTVPGEQELLLTASHFSSKWDASGQIPQRAIDQGLIGRFGAVDDTEGGQTSRTNFVLDHSKNLGDGKTLNTMAFVSHYDFELYSNFTFFLEDPVNGDQIKQKENRLLLGAKTVYENNAAQLGTLNFKYKAGIGFRYDNIDDNELSHTRNRQELLNRLAFGDVDETNTYAFAMADFKLGKFTLEPAIRMDYFKFDYINKMSGTYDSQSEEKVAFSPKFNTIYSLNENAQLFLKTGIGFHSNDTRVVVANEGQEILPAAYGVDFGTILKPMDKLVVNATIWTLFLDQEFVYVGDAGIVEPSGKTRRLGIEIGGRYQPTDGVYLYTDATFTHGRSTEEPDGENYIPLAPDFTMVGGLSLGKSQGFSGGINYRYVDDRPANEDNSIVAEGYFVTDATLNYSSKNWTFSLIVENLFDTEWNETQFATESRLFNETASVEEIHFTPGMPFYLRGKIAVTF
ncbi:MULTISPECIES: carboxypeptidase-like regulatory domain-containing protein [Flavobacteriaceae]|uniref:TonB-dependent receptor n=1 Tax=Flavobacteriaceae TaxID=49546 RepID=UPI00149202E6|nr:MULTISPECIES: carboxypeptidase-like regulatory domain-containing protein [Allomuricauda]MDC6367676.1 carboxypeptidase-like regulatory domain-containing protein [Muricauda sp. AC10]